MSIELEKELKQLKQENTLLRQENDDLKRQIEVLTKAPYDSSKPVSLYEYYAKKYLEMYDEAHVSRIKRIDEEIKNLKSELSKLTDSQDREDIEWLTKKIANMRIFDDENGVMNKSVTDVNGDILAVSQFTLMASTKKGNRPSYIKAAKPEISVPLYEEFCCEMEIAVNKPIKRGVFGADMKVELLNDGPVTIFIDTKNRE